MVNIDTAHKTGVTNTPGVMNHYGTTQWINWTPRRQNKNSGEINIC